MYTSELDSREECCGAQPHAYQGGLERSLEQVACSLSQSHCCSEEGRKRGGRRVGRRVGRRGGGKGGGGGGGQVSVSQ